MKVVLQAVYAGWRPTLDVGRGMRAVQPGSPARAGRYALRAKALELLAEGEQSDEPVSKWCRDHSATTTRPG